MAATLSRKSCANALSGVSSGLMKLMSAFGLFTRSLMRSKPRTLFTFDMLLLMEEWQSGERTYTATTNVKKRWITRGTVKVQCEASSDCDFAVVALLAINEGDRKGSRQGNRVVGAASPSAKPAVSNIIISVACTLSPASATTNSHLRPFTCSD